MRRVRKSHAAAAVVAVGSVVGLAVVAVRVARMVRVAVVQVAVATAIDFFASA